DLEYGTATVEIHSDAITPGSRVLIIDDVLATGGTGRAAVGLGRKAGGTVVGFSFLLALSGLHGREKMPDVALHGLLAASDRRPRPWPGHPRECLRVLCCCPSPTQGVTMAVT